MKAVVFILVLAFLMPFPAAAGKMWRPGCAASKEPENTLSGMVQEWKATESPRVFLQGYDLSVCFVIVPEKFLSQMASEPDVFQEWLRDLHFHTFRVNLPEGGVMAEMEAAGLSRLKSRMIKVAERHGADGTHGEQAKLILGELVSISITYPGDPMKRPQD